MGRIEDIVEQLRGELEDAIERERAAVADREAIQRALDALDGATQLTMATKARPQPQSEPRPKPATKPASSVRQEMDLGGGSPRRNGQSARIIEFVAEHGKTKASDLVEAGICDAKRAGIALCNLVAAGKLRKFAPGLYGPLPEA